LKTATTILNFSEGFGESKNVFLRICLGGKKKPKRGFTGRANITPLKAVRLKRIKDRDLE
jgi:hypothetical protein